MRRRTLAAVLALGTALGGVPAWAESLADSMVAAYRHSSLLDQNRALLRAADEDVASATAALRPVVQWVASHNFTRSDGVEIVSDTVQLVGQMTLYDWGRNQLAIDIAKEQVLATRESLVAVEQDVLLTAVQAFLDVRSAEQQVALQSNSLQLLTRERQAALAGVDAPVARRPRGPRRRASRGRSRSGRSRPACRSGRPAPRQQPSRRPRSRRRQPSPDRARRARRRS